MVNTYKFDNITYTNAFDPSNVYRGDGKKSISVSYDQNIIANGANLYLVLMYQEGLWVLHSTNTMTNAVITAASSAGRPLAFDLSGVIGVAIYPGNTSSVVNMYVTEYDQSVSIASYG